MLQNTGRVSFDFSTLPQDLGGNPENPPPGQPLVIPSSVRDGAIKFYILVTCLVKLFC